MAIRLRLQWELPEIGQNTLCVGFWPKAMHATLKMLWLTAARPSSRAGSCTPRPESHLGFMKKAGSTTYLGSFERYSSSESREETLDRLDMLARLFDTAFILPGTNIRFGVEAVMRLVPGIGDAAASALSCWLLYEAHRLGVPKHVFARMAANVAIEGLVGAVPFLGDMFDVGFRANRRNVKILQEYFMSKGFD
jgi:hypothetical protein